MRLVCGPEALVMPADRQSLRVILYGQPGAADRASAGKAVRSDILRARLDPSPKAWDLLSLALSVMTADCALRRNTSSDGWTREFVLNVAVNEPDFWMSQAAAIEKALAFLTTDRWQLIFCGNGFLPSRPDDPVYPEQDSVVLLSGGLDSLVGTIDLVAAGRKPFAVSQIVRGDAEKQIQFARSIGGHLRHLQMNHNASAPNGDETSQRARSLIFLAFGVLAATTLHCYHEGATVPLFACENGFIAINPPLTASRIGSLSTRTAHPEFLNRIQAILDAAELRLRIENPYQLKTKGEMLAQCCHPEMLKEHAANSTSCGRFQRFNYNHCGRCVPCQVRRAAFLASGLSDATAYVYDRLGQDDEEHARFDDVRSVAMALADTQDVGFDAWLGPAFSFPLIGDVASLKSLVQRGLAELTALHKAQGVR